MTVVEEHAEYYDDGGEFLPLSIWQARGFNLDITTMRPEDKKVHPVLGDTYKVSILKSGHRGSKGANKTDTLSGKPSTASSSGGPDPLLAIEDEDGSDASSNSSVSSSRKKSKKAKKAKKAKKQSKKEKKEKKAKELKRKREVEENKASVSSTAYVGNYC